jgi:ubiquinone/menaquinone biosynthesis C-methylase UbiE
LQTIENEYAAKSGYRNNEKALNYDRLRYDSLHGKLKDWTKKRAIGKALAMIGPIQSILDLPCGTGRFRSFLARRGYQVIGADISYQMMLISKRKQDRFPDYQGYSQCDAENISFKENSVDCVLSIRFMFHLPPHVRKNALLEMRRITRRWVIVDFRYSTLKTFARKIGTLLHLGREKTRLDLEEISRELAGLGFKVHKIIRVLPIFSEKVIFVCEKV